MSVSEQQDESKTKLEGIRVKKTCHLKEDALWCSRNTETVKLWFNLALK
jgi:hypothetical protein